MRVVRFVGVVLSAVIAAVVVAVASTMTTAHAATALIVGGTKPTNILPDFVMSALLNGYFADYDSRVNVPYPAEVWPVTGSSDLTVGNSIRIGTFVVDVAVRLIPGPKTVAGISQGGVVVDEVLHRLANDPTAPPKDELNFVIIASTTRGNGILTYFPEGMYIPILDYTVRPVPETHYDVTVVTSEYDGWADFPDRPNLFAVANAIVGMVVVHWASPFADLSKVPTENITITTNSKGGVTTSYFIETEHLPLLFPLRLIGVPEPLVAAIEEPLRLMVDAGYSRNDNAAVTTSGTSDLSTEITPESLNQTIDSSVGPPSEPVNSGAHADPGSASRRVCCSDFGNSTSPADSSTALDSGSLALDTNGAASPATPTEPTDPMSTVGSVDTSAGAPSAADPLDSDPSADPSDGGPADPPARGGMRTGLPSTAPDATADGPNRFVPRLDRVLKRGAGSSTTNSTAPTTNTITSTDTTSGSPDTGANIGGADGAGGGEGGEK
jgi:hypothetical protein